MRRRKRSARRSESGMTMIELMIAGVVLTIGMTGVMIMMTTGIASNNRNRRDTAGTMVVQGVLEQIAAQRASVNITIPMQDCRPASLGGPQTLSLSNTGAASPGAGANLTGNGQEIDFTQLASSVPNGYRMTYFSCGANDREVAYDVRWNVRNITTVGGTTYSKLVTVAARQQSSAASVQLGYFAPPVTLRTIVGD